MKSGNVLLGVLAGVAAGSLLGILMAPEKGSKSRAQIRDLGEGLVGTLKDKIDELSSYIRGVFENDQKAVDKIASKVKSLSEAVKTERVDGIV